MHDVNADRASCWLLVVGLLGRFIFALCLLIGVLLGSGLALAQGESLIFDKNELTRHDSILIVNAAGERIYDWQSDQARVPASLVKILTAWLAIDRWGLDYRFVTEFYWHEGVLWVRGLGDPYLISEELDKIVLALRSNISGSVTGIGLDSSLFEALEVPGQGNTNDPYNAPLSALSVNFNTVSFKYSGQEGGSDKRLTGALLSGEKQTPLTPLAKELASQIADQSPTMRRLRRPQRINLGSPAAAQQQFAQLLSIKLGLELDFDRSSVLHYGVVPVDAQLLYRHENSNRLSTVIRGALKYSNNFIANQLFLLLGASDGSGSLTFSHARKYLHERLSFVVEPSKRPPLATQFWQEQLSQIKLVEGAGLSRENQLSANQMQAVLEIFSPYQELLKRYPLSSGNYAFAKSGTLTGVHALAGYLHVGEQVYKFVFLFNRTMPYNYRENLLQRLATALQAEES